jgi:transposase
VDAPADSLRRFLQNQGGPRPARPAAGRQGLTPSARPALICAGAEPRRPSRSRPDQRQARAAKGSAGGRPPAFDAESYKQRNTVERATSKLKDFRAVAMRTDKREFIYQGTIDIASIKIWLRHPANQDASDTP